MLVSLLYVGMLTPNVMELGSGTLGGNHVIKGRGLSTLVIEILDWVQ